MFILRLTILVFVMIIGFAGSSHAQSAQEAFEASCYDDVGFVRDINKQNLTCQCVGYHMRLYMPERLLKKDMDSLKEKHLLKLKKAAAKSLIGCMDHFIGDLFQDICERAAFEHGMQVDCSCMSKMGQYSLEAHRPNWMDQIDDQEQDFSPEIIIGSAEVKRDIADAMQMCQ